ncbi:hypothetical protein SNE26_27595 [Mucilaginibacter sp. cycad4]|uniref:hypothetical protein n=1 Tax=Mucilaginibacter sp. cycad4 TaxID=3342096 RepID=UPI002AAA9239|nr:hypothetical protein [Mucilaginibacter gossypii]WPU99779.1 hypothetical protein SNE26_27595 [Mucilaginibacter gossypii]
MNTDLNIKEILLQVERPDKQAQRKPKQKKSKIKLSGISGLGTSLWSTTDIDNYIAEERQW